MSVTESECISSSATLKNTLNQLFALSRHFDKRYFSMLFVMYASFTIASFSESDFYVALNGFLQSSSFT